MVTKTIKAGFLFIATTSLSFLGAQEKQKLKQQSKNDKIEVKQDRSERLFKHLDINADNSITLAEFKEKQMKSSSSNEKTEKQFAIIDTDHNGTIDRKEFKTYYNSNLKPTKTENQIKAQNKKKTVEKG